MLCIGMYFLSPKSTKKCRCSVRAKKSSFCSSASLGNDNFSIRPHCDAADPRREEEFSG